MPIVSPPANYTGASTPVPIVSPSANQVEVPKRMLVQLPPIYLCQICKKKFLTKSISSPTKHLAVTTAQDIRNIVKKYQINGDTIRNENDVLSDEAWIYEMLVLDQNPILMYKLPGEGISEFPDLEKEDFILCFMNEALEELFKIYGNEVLCIDSTHGTNKYNIQLTSLLIKDDNWEGFLVAFL
ncbi:hypothetical protein HNY73_011274 [Argiope bruennichi]|uniref:ZSWIM1/3 RNaseH-like domain-containing protein n=1 Tax=Argiope bruennichi TaxID=94029 RepID=A0A8T0F629_ARGBR|nr:hypothetical protein HNY73_011274 [Argiope bruennichi]